MDESLHPESGGRVLLELETVDEAFVRYRVTLFTPSGHFDGRARVELSGGQSLVEGLDRAPGWLVGQVRPFLRQLWTARRDGEGPRWPRRVLRWRQER